MKIKNIRKYTFKNDFFRLKKVEEAQDYLGSHQIDVAKCTVCRKRKIKYLVKDPLIGNTVCTWLDNIHTKYINGNNWICICEELNCLEKVRKEILFLLLIKGPVNNED